MKVIYIVHHSNGQLSLTTQGILVGNAIDDTPSHIPCDVDDTLFADFLDNPSRYKAVLENGNYSVAVLQ